MLWIAKFELADPQLGVMISEIVFCFSCTYTMRFYIGALNGWIMISFCQEMAFLAVFKQGSSGTVECTSASLCLCWADSRFLAGKRKWVGP